jgi:S-methyl-1-thioxylulose 5-phosphate methylthiotransferase
MGVVHRRMSDTGGPTWDYATVAVKEYTSGNATPGSTRRILIGQDEGADDFIVRYFTIPAGGHSALESHSHQHGVVIVHGRARVLLGEEWTEVGAGDAVFIGSNEVHQLRALGDQPLGFICVISSRAKRPAAHQTEQEPSALVAEGVAP